MTKALLFFTLLLFTAGFHISARQESGVEVRLFDCDADWNMPGSISVAELCHMKPGDKILTVMLNGKPLLVKKITLALDINSTKQSFMDPQSTDIINEQELGQIKKMQPGDEIRCTDIVYITPDHKDVKMDTKYRIRVRN